MLLKMSIPDDKLFPAPLPTVIRRRFQVTPATFLIPIDLFFSLVMKDFYDTRYKSGSFSLLNQIQCYPVF